MMYRHTNRRLMAKKKVAVTLDSRPLDRTRLLRESAKLDRGEERALADEGLEADLTEWPELSEVAPLA